MSVAIKFTEKYYTTAQAAELLGVETDTVKVYCNTDRIKGEKVGHIWMVPESEIKRYKQDESNLGRPKKSKRDWSPLSIGPLGPFYFPNYYRLGIFAVALLPSRYKLPLMATINISGRVVVVDECDVDRVSAIRWRIEKRETLERHGNKPYARNREVGYLHKWIVGAGRGVQVDHRNGDTLDNRRSNLRVATRSQNCWNTKVKRGRSVFKGVSPSGRAGRRWRAQIKKDRRTMFIGAFSTPLEAALAYDDAAVRLFGEFAAPNFPERFYGKEVSRWAKQPPTTR
jgi:excisionase family DNA binding protein